MHWLSTNSFLEMSTGDQQAANNMFADDDNMAVDDNLPMFSVGQTSIDLSHKGGEYEDFQDLAEQVGRINGT